MKKYIILLAVVACGILSSCGVYTETPRSTFKAFLDFRPYLSEGGSFKIEKTYAGNKPVYSVRATCLKIEK